MPKLGALENPRSTTGSVDDGNVERVVKVIPTDGCHLRVRLERLLGAVSGNRLTHPGLAGFPTDLTIHPQARRYETGSTNAVDGIMLIVRDWPG